ncbi:hypothetical protein [Streptomyces sp. NPDC052496]|uniref:hypothetical protein n=1 Tax=Streptomyces sp. NPDC052496 TaxID=3154951 RepID=UPI0034288A8C
MNSSPAGTPTVRGNRTRAALRTVTLAACVPYLSLKLAWLSGSRVGIPAGSALRRDGNSLMTLNALTVLMDAAVIVLAFLLTRPWGRRVPSWLMALPMWCATGLLAPIIVVFPVQTLFALVRGAAADGTGSAAGGPDGLLAPWVWGLVYGGFIVQGLALGTLFVLYARDRWGHLWRGRTGGLPVTPTLPARQSAAVAAAVAAALPAAVHGLWASGQGVGLSAARLAGQDFDARLNDAAYVLFALFTAVGVLAVGFRRGGRTPLLLPLAAAWTGSAALACWGGWMTLTTLTATAADPRLPTPVMSLTYAVQMIVGMLVAVTGAHFLAERHATTRAASEAARCG